MMSSTVVVFCTYIWQKDVYFQLLIGSSYFHDLYPILHILSVVHWWLSGVSPSPGITRMKCFLALVSGGLPQSLSPQEISVFSCWQSTYLPFSVEYMCGMNTQRWEKRGENVAGVVRFSCEFAVLSEKWSFQWNNTSLYGSLPYSAKHIPRGCFLPPILFQYATVHVDSGTFKNNCMGWFSYFHAPTITYYN